MAVTRYSLKDFDATKRFPAPGQQVVRNVVHTISSVFYPEGLRLRRQWSLNLFRSQQIPATKFAFKQAALSSRTPFGLGLGRVYSVSGIPQPNTLGSRHALALLIPALQTQKWPFLFGNEFKAKLSVAFWWLEVLSAAAEWPKHQRIVP